MNMKDIKEKIEHIEIAKIAGLISNEAVRNVRKWMDYVNQHDKEAMKLHQRAKKAISL